MVQKLSQSQVTTQIFKFQDQCGLEGHGQGHQFQTHRRHFYDQ